MSRPKTRYYKASDGTYTVIDADAICPDGSQHTHRRDGIKTEPDVQKALINFDIEQRRTRTLLQHQHMGFQPVTIGIAQQKILASPNTSTPLRMTLPSRYKSAIDVVGGDEYYLNYLENPDEKQEFDQKIQSAFGAGTSKTRNTRLWINQLITNSQKTGILPDSVPKLHCGVAAPSKCLKTRLNPEIEHQRILDFWLRDHINDVTDYEMHSFAVAAKTYLSVKQFSWSYVEIIRVSDWVRPLFSISRLPQRCPFPRLLDAYEAADAIDTMVVGKNPDAYLFSADSIGLKPLSYRKKMWFRKTLSRRLFGQRIDLSAFRQTENSIAA